MSATWKAVGEVIKWGSRLLPGIISLGRSVWGIVKSKSNKAEDYREPPDLDLTDERREADRKADVKFGKSDK